MPRIDDLNLSLGKFKKSSVRSWDDDLVSSLRINSSDKGVKDAKHVIQGDASADIQTKPVDEGEMPTRGDKLSSQRFPEGSKQKKIKKNRLKYLSTFLKSESEEGITGLRSEKK